MNPFLEQRVSALVAHLRAVHAAGDGSASANRGTEREAFVSAFLAHLLPPVYRVGAGEVTDVNGARSGQLDIVIEMPWAPSIGLPGSPVRLFPAETVGVAIEVKSDLSKQWDEVTATAGAFAPLRQRLSGQSTGEGSLTVHTVSIEPMPLFAVGYHGWSKPPTVAAKLGAVALDGILVIDEELFVETDRLAVARNADRLGEHPELAAIAMINSAPTSVSDGDVASGLNAQRLENRTMRLDEVRDLPVVAAGAWTAADVKTVRDGLAPRITTRQGPVALVAFVARIHAELFKRSAMSVDLMAYAR